MYNFVLYNCYNFITFVYNVIISWKLMLCMRNCLKNFYWPLVNEDVTTYKNIWFRFLFMNTNVWNLSGSNPILPFFFHRLQCIEKFFRVTRYFLNRFFGFKHFYIIIERSNWLYSWPWKPSKFKKVPRIRNILLFS